MKPYEMLAEKIMLRIKEGITPDLIGKAALDAIEEYANQQCELKDKQIEQLREALKDLLPYAEAKVKTLIGATYAEEMIDKAKSLTKPTE